MRKGVRRADVLMGVGLNASELKPPISHLLSSVETPTIRLVKEKLNDAEKAHVALEFGKWVRTNGLRELLETFSIFMCELYRTVFLIRLHQKQLDRKFNKCRPQKFERMGIGDQIARLAEVFSVSEDSIKIVRSLNKARNCYAHRNGVVGFPDRGPETRNLQLFWSALQLQIREPDGNVVIWKDAIGKIFENGGTVQLKIVQQARAFDKGNELVLEKEELKEICLCVLFIGQSLFNEAVSIAKGAGILQHDVNDSLVDPKPV